MAVSSDSQGLYRLLGVARTASPDEIKAAFRERAKLYHPDLGGQADDERFRRLRDAYEVLRDPHRRLQYDAEELDAERRRDRARHAAADGPAATARGRERRPAWLAPAGLGAALALGALVAASVLAVGRGREAERLRAELAELRLGLGAADAGAGPAGSAPAVDEDGQDVLHTASFVFPPESAEIEGALAAEIDNRLAELGAAVSALPAEGGWSLLIDGRSGRAASEAGVAVEDWELTLLRVATLTDLLLARVAVPPDRVAVRFRAGLAPPGAPPDDGRTVEVSLLCCGP